MDKLRDLNGHHSEHKPKEFDTLFGGSIELPMEVKIERFVNSRISEINALTEAIDNPQKTAMVFQQLPKHMRRRVMSHSVKRMPFHLREAHSSTLEKCGAKEPGKRPSRKFRRRPRNLLSEYTRRQRENVWLPTHIWHAKRFHMVNKWGYRLAEHPNDKSFRACYRASAYHSLIQDISFMVCLEVCGLEEDILQGLGRLAIGGFGAKPYLSGAREGHTLIRNLTTGKPIGQVSFMWEGRTEGRRRLWIWAHPAFHLELTDQLTAVFTDQVSVTSLKDQLARFRLTGPKSVGIVTSALSLCESTEGLSGWTESLNTEEWVSALSQQNEYYKKVQQIHSSEQLPPFSILPVTAVLTLPKKPTKHTRQETREEILEELVGSVKSALWEEEARRGMSSKAGDETVVGALLVQRPSGLHRETGYGGGMDVIGSCSCAMGLWLALVHHGARAAGLREADNISCLTASPPLLPIDSQSGLQDDISLADALQQKFFRLPPAKRPNYIKLGAVSPFRLEWELLKKDWACDELVRVSILLRGKGTLGRCSHVCVPLPSDLAQSEPPREPPHPDPHHQLRTASTLAHKALLKRMAARRKRLRQKNCSELPDTTDIKAQHKDTMEHLWLPENHSVRNSTSREIMGFIVNGSFSYLDGKCYGIGYVTKNSLDLLKKDTSNYIALVRSVDNLNYRFANVIIL